MGGIFTRPQWADISAINYQHRMGCSKCINTSIYIFVIIEWVIFPFDLQLSASFLPFLCCLSCCFNLQWHCQSVFLKLFWVNCSLRFYFRAPKMWVFPAHTVHCPHFCGLQPKMRLIFCYVCQNECVRVPKFIKGLPLSEALMKTSNE